MARGHGLCGKTATCCGEQAVGNVWDMQGSSQQAGLAPPPDKQQALHSHTYTHVNIRRVGRGTQDPCMTLSATCKQGDPCYPRGLRVSCHSCLSPSRQALFRRNTHTHIRQGTEHTHASLVDMGRSPPHSSQRALWLSASRNFSQGSHTLLTWQAPAEHILRKHTQQWPVPVRPYTGSGHGTLLRLPFCDHSIQDGRGHGLITMPGASKSLFMPLW